MSRSKFEDRLNRFKSGQIWVSERLFEKSRVTNKLMMTNIIENFVADNYVFGTEVLAHNPEELPLEIWEFTNFHNIHNIESKSFPFTQ